MTEIPEPLRRRMSELENQDALDRVREFLGGYFADAESFAEVATGLRRVAEYTTRRIERDLRAVEDVLDRQLPAGVLAHIIAWEANWVLDDPSDAGALEFLRKVADMLRSVLADVGTPPAPPTSTSG